MPVVLTLIDLMSWAPSWFARPSVQGLGATAVTIGAAYSVEFIIRHVLLRLAARTHTQLDDRIIELLRRPVFLSVIFAGLAWSTALMEVGATPERLAFGLLKSLAVVVWATAAFRTGRVVLTAVGGRANPRLVSPETLPAFLILLRVGLIGAALYFVFLAWKVDLTAWLASAGIIGIAVGFAAKDTLANLFAGVFIIADAPYKVGDWIVIDGNLRGRVVHIGIRSTRMATRDDIEITIPNSVIGNSKIVNEDAGPMIPHRVRIYVQAAYGSDVDLVRDVLLSCAVDVENVCAEPEPDTRFRAFGDSGLKFELLVWCNDSSRRGKLISTLTTNIYKAFNKAGLEIPFQQIDMHIKSGELAPATTQQRSPAAASRPLRSPQPPA